MSTNQIINDVEPRTQLIATNLQTVFNADWTADVAASVLVYARATGVAANDSTQLIASSNYSVTFIGASETVRVTFSVGRATGDIVTLVRDTDSSRLNLYTDTNFTPSMLNQDFGTETLVQQQNKMYGRDLAPHYNSSAIIQDFDLVLPILPALYGWRMNEAGDEIETVSIPDGGFAPADAPYLIQTADADLPQAQVMGALASGFVVNTLTSGVQQTRTLTGTSSQIGISNIDGISGNPTFTISDNPTLPGTGHFNPPQGTTAQRPSIPTDGMVRYNTTLSALEVYESSQWDEVSGGVVDSVVGTASQIDVNSADAANPIVSLSETIDTPGTFDIQTTTTVDSILDEDNLSSNSATALATQQSIKAYVDNVAGGGFTVILTALLASTAALTVTYANGTAGVGATLTNADTQVALTVDGVLTQVADRILIKDQAAELQNGVYQVTTVGTGSTNWVLTRVTDYDSPAEIIPGTLVPVSNGTVNGGSIWLETATVTTVGTDDIIFSEFAQPSGSYVTIATNQTVTGQKTFDANVEIGNSATLDLNTTTAVDAILDEDTMSSDSATSLATQQSIKAYVDAQVGGSGGFQSYQVFTSSGTWTRPSGISSVMVQVIGGGGGGGSAPGGTLNTLSTGGGGGGGGFSQIYIDVSSLASETVTVGAAGAGGPDTTNPGQTGSTGGTSSFGAYATATGGNGGLSMYFGSFVSIAAGGSGGTGGSGNINTDGYPGATGIIHPLISLSSGHGGGSYLGGGGASVYLAGTGFNAGFTPATLGGGGSGAGQFNSGTGGAGGAGASGVVIVYEYS